MTNDKKGPKKQRATLVWLKKNFCPTVCFFEKNTQAQNVNTQLLTKLQGIMLMFQKIIFTTLDHDSPAINKIWCIDFIT